MHVATTLYFTNRLLITYLSKLQRYPRWINGCSTYFDAYKYTGFCACHNCENVWITSKSFL